MSAQKLILWSHIVLALSGLYEILTGSQGLIGWVLFVVGMAGVQARQARKMGWFGYLGLAILLLGSLASLLLYLAGNNVYSYSLFATQTGKSIAYLLFETSIVTQTGYFLYGLASLRAGILPQVVSLLLAIAVVMMIVAGSFGQGLCMVAVGILLSRSKLPEPQG